jgi:hypothetical protein
MEEKKQLKFKLTFKKKNKTKDEFYDQTEYTSYDDQYEEFEEEDLFDDIVAGGIFIVKNPCIVDEKMSFLPKPEEISAFSMLTDQQLRAVKYIVDESRKNAILKEYELFNRIKNAKHVQRLLQYIRDDAPIIIHVNIACLCDVFLKDGFYRNLFETATSRGSNSFSPRIAWENRMFNSIYDEKTPAIDRVKYGALNVLNDPYGIRSCYNYGDSYFRLKRVRLRTSFADCDTSSMNAVLSSCEHYCHVLVKYTDIELNAALDVVLNRKRYVNSDVIAIYKEVQIHGPVSLSENVEALVVNPVNRENIGLVENINKLGEKYGFDIQWMDQI